MTTLDAVNAGKKPDPTAEAAAAAELVRMAKEKGWSLTGPDGLLRQLTKTVLETALNEEMTEHLGYEKHDPAGRESGNFRNGTRAKTVLTESTGHVAIEVPRTGPAPSSRSSSRSGNPGSPGSMRSCCRCMRRVDHRRDLAHFQEIY